jgi:nucleoside-diphosphate-sugar epimerase
VVHGNLLAADAPDASGHVMNLAMGGRIDLVTLVDKINAILGTNITPEFTDERRGDILHSRAGIDKARDLLDFTPIVDFDEGLRRTIAWYQEQS